MRSLYLVLYLCILKTIPIASAIHETKHNTNISQIAQSVPAELWGIIFDDFYKQPQTLNLLSREYALPEHLFDFIAESYINQTYLSFPQKTDIEHIIRYNFSTVSSHINKAIYQAKIRNALLKYITYLEQYRQLLITIPDVCINQLKINIYQQPYARLMSINDSLQLQQECNAISTCENKKYKLLRSITNYEKLLAKATYYYIQAFTNISKKYPILTKLLVRIFLITSWSIEHIKHYRHICLIGPLIYISLMFHSKSLFIMSYILFYAVDIIREYYIDNIQHYLYEQHRPFFILEKLRSKLTYLKRAIDHQKIFNMH